MPQHPKTVSLKGFQGLNNVLPPERTPQQYLKEAQNVDIDKTLRATLRDGYQRLSSGSYHSIWSDGSRCFTVKDQDLLEIYTDYAEIALKAGVGDDKIFFNKTNDLYYFMSPTCSGVIDGDAVREWGIKRPVRSPFLIETLGGLRKGRYQVAITYVSVDGRESGTGIATYIDLPNDGAGITVSNIPTSSDSTVDRVRIYCSTQDGDILYWVNDVSNGTFSSVIYTENSLTLPLKTFNLSDPPLGQIIRYYNSRIFIAQGNILWYTEPYAYEHIDLSKNFFQFEGHIKAVMPVQEGIWVAADKLYYLAGKDPTVMRRIMKEPISVVEGSDVEIVGAYVFLENTPIGSKWLFTSDKGIYVAYNDGVVINTTEKNVVFPQADEGTAAFIQKDGINRYVSLLKDKRDSQNVVAGDLVTATVIRNGVAVTE